MAFIPQTTQDLFDQYTAQLPSYMSETITSSNWQEEVARVGAKHHLNTNQIANLIVETGLVIMMIANPELYVRNIVNHIGVSEGIAKEIAQDMIERVFNMLQEKMIHDHEFEIQVLQEELTRLDLQDEQDANQEDTLQQVGVEILEGDDDKQEDSSGVRGQQLVEQKIRSSFSLDTPTPSDMSVGYAEHDPYHEPFDSVSDSDNEPVRQAPPAPPTPNVSEPTPAPPSVPSMVVPPAPPTPPQQ